MKRTNADGNVAGLFSDGDPATGAPPTVVDAASMNALQEEIAKAIEDAGITLDGLSTGAQLVLAIQKFASDGGPIAAFKFTIANTQTVAANVTGLVFDHTVVHGVRIHFQMSQKTDTAASERVYSGFIWLQYSDQDSAWKITGTNVGEDADSAGVIFSVTAGGQVQYTSDTLAGANYAGVCRFNDIRTFAI